MTENPSHGDTYGRKQGRLTKPFVVPAKYLCDNDQTEPLKVLFGRDTLSMTQLTPIFNLSKKGGYDGGKAKDYDGSQPDYYGGVALAFCAGAVDKVYKIYNGEDVLFSNDAGVALTSDETTLTVSGRGVLTIYKGTATQTVSSIFDEDIKLDPENEEATIPAGTSPAYKNIFYFTSPDFLYGHSNTTPNIRVEACCYPQTFFADLQEKIDAGGVFEFPNFGEVDGGVDVTVDENTNVTIPFVDESGDVYPPFIVYELLRNSIWGSAKLSADDLDLQRFLIAIKKSYDDGIAVSAVFDSKQTVRDAISQALEYCNGLLYLSDGKIALKIIDAKDDVLEITDAELTDEPSVSLSDATTKWGFTSVSYNNRENAYESTAAVFENPASEGGRKSFNLPWIKSAIVADLTAKRLGNAGLEQSSELNCSILPYAFDELNIGSLVRLNYKSLSSKLFTVTELRRGSPSNPSVSIHAVSVPETDWKIENELDISVIPSRANMQANPAEGGWFTPRIAPASLTNGKAITVFCSNEKKCSCDYYRIDNLADAGTSYALAEKYSNFQIVGTISGWSVLQGGKIRVTYAPHSSLTADFQKLVGSGSQKYLATLAGVGNAHAWLQMQLKVLNITPTGVGTFWLDCDVLGGYAIPDTENSVNMHSVAYVFDESTKPFTMAVSDQLVLSVEKSAEIALQAYFRTAGYSAVKDGVSVTYTDSADTQGVQSLQVYHVDYEGVRTEGTGSLWGSIVSATGNNKIVVAAGEPSASLATDDALAAHVDSENGNIYEQEGADGGWYYVKNVYVPATAKAEDKRYFLSLSGSTDSTISHRQGYAGVVVINLSSDADFTLPAGKVGDTIFVNVKKAPLADIDVKCTVSGSFSDAYGETKNTISIYSGMTARLVCVQNGATTAWLYQMNSDIIL